MADDRIIVAIERIERALTRLERIGQLPSSTAPPFVSERPSAPERPSAELFDYAALAERHARLRAEMETALSSLDRLIAGIDAAGVHG